ncbi:MAG: HD domain-containing protein [Fibrobacter sp.]|nr:HD domain-containing protein [Fibrobacter sp.]
MISDTVYTKILTWFNAYTRSFIDSEPIEKRAATLKFDHTLLVVKNNSLLCDSISIDNKVRLLSDIVALLHDIGRFEQFKKFKTFADRHSVNHAELGIQIIKQHNVLEELEIEYQYLIQNAIMLHNVPSIPPETDGVQKLLCQLIRDADKLDIYRIASEHYKNPDSRDSRIIGIGVTEENTVSEEIVAAICAKKSVDYSQMKSINDFKLVQLGWVFDLNFTMSVHLITARNHYYDILNSLPRNKTTNAVVDVIEQHIKHVLKDFNS